MGLSYFSGSYSGIHIDISRGYNKNKDTAAVFIDTEKAFERFWHPEIFLKLVSKKHDEINSSLQRKLQVK